MPCTSGYGFLAEHEDSPAPSHCGSRPFIGPTPQAIGLMGQEDRRKRLPPSEPVCRLFPAPPPRSRRWLPTSRCRTQALARAIGYPLLVKAVSGGGGKGMLSVLDPSDLAGAVRAARSEADSAFGDAAVYIERRLARPRHIEVQILGDEHGTVLPFVERECSVQRRHQKVVEETPSVAVTPELRQAMAAAAASVARAVGYTSAGTIEFLVGDDGRFFFLEMNTRLQVEHPITELVTGIDLVQWQIRIARASG